MRFASLLPLTIVVLNASCSADMDQEGLSADAGSQVGAADAKSSEEIEDSCPRARVSVAPGNRLNVRPSADTAGSPVASLPNNTVVAVLAKVQGQEIDGDTTWYQIDSGIAEGFVSAQFADCTKDEAPLLEPPAQFFLPLACGTSATITQANDGGFSHQGRAFYAFDFGIGVDIPLVAMADGIVLYTFGETGPGDACYNGGGSSCFPYANYVALLHGDGTGSIYKHLNKVLVTEGEFVPSGSPVGLSGSTGYSTGPHAHVMRQEECGAATSCQSVAISFADVPGNGVPSKGQTVTSGNCQ